LKKGGGLFLFTPIEIYMGNSQLTAIVVTAIAGTLGVIKFKLIEELVKKITSDDSKVRPYSIISLIMVAILLGLIASSFPTTIDDDSQSREIVQAETPTPVGKSDLEVKVDAVKDGVALTKDLVGTIKENKQRKDSIFEAGKSERWVIQISDWTDDDDRILELHEALSSVDEVKLLKVRKQYLFIIEDGISKDQLEASLDSVSSSLNGFKPRLYNLNDVLTRKKDKLIERTETFGRRKNKVKIQCLVLD
jgi:hypothetical protein